MEDNYEWEVLGAIHTGAPHKRERIWILANAEVASGLESQNETYAESVIRQGGNGLVGSGEALADDTSIGQRARRKGRSNPSGARKTEPPFLADTGGGRCCRSQIGEVEQPGRAEAVCSGETLADAAGISEREQADQANTVATRRQARDESLCCCEYEDVPHSDGAGCEEQRGGAAR